MTKKFLPLLFIITFFNCKEKNDQIKLNLSVKESINLSQIFEIKHIVKVRYDRVIPPIEKVLKAHDLYFVLSNANIYAIDSFGMIINQLITQQNEYLYKYIHDFDIYDNMIYVKHSGKKITKLTKDFKEIDVFAKPYTSRSFKILSDSTCALYTGFNISPGRNKQLYIYSMKSGEILHSFLEVLPQLNYYNFLSSNNILYLDGKNYFWNGMDQTIHTFDESSVNPAIQLDYGSKSLPKDFYSLSKFGDVQEYSLHMAGLDLVSRFYNARLGKNYFLASICLGKDRFFVIKNLKTYEEHAIRNINDDILKTGIISILDENVSFLPVSEGQFVLYRDNNDLQSDSTHVGTLIFGNFKF